jgi:hypothetical protein
MAYAVKTAVVLWLVRAVALCWLLGCPLCGGHGVGPIGYLALGANDERWRMPRRRLIGAAVSLFLAIALQRRKAGRALGSCGMGLSLVSWLCFLRESECIMFGAIFSVPAAVTIVCVEAWSIAAAGRTKWRFGLTDTAEFVAYAAVATAVAVRAPL